ncbi:MAG: rhomboid family intramembrane serine protease [Alistipes sp.]|nr:rhomboid family intramembrane serine protease [Alistipes sp.]
MAPFRTNNTTPPVVMNLMIANVVVFVATMLMESDLIRFQLFNLDLRSGAQELWMAMTSASASFDPNWSQAHFSLWQPLTYMFMHGGFSHLFFNMFSLWIFGRTLEIEMGWKRFLTYYLVCGVGAALFQMGVAQIDLSHMEVGSLEWQAYMSTPTVGASGAIFGLLLAFGMMHPNAIISLIFPPIAMKAKWFVIIYGALELLLGVSGTMDNVAHFAHLGGMFWGWLLILWWRHRDRNRVYYF